MEKKDFPKGTKPREIFVYTCERIAEPLIPLGYKYRKSKNDIYKKDGIFVFSLYYRVVVIKAPLQGLCYTVRDAVDW